MVSPIQFVGSSDRLRSVPVILDLVSEAGSAVPLATPQQMTLNHRVTGSIPVAPTTQSSGLELLPAYSHL
jgi:hypothetical protein